MRASINFFSLMLVLLLALTASAPVKGYQDAQNQNAKKRVRQVRAGEWGGEHIAMFISETGATFELDCGRGTVDQPFVKTAPHTFTAGGTFIREHGGPIRQDEEPERHPAQFTSIMKGKTMTLTITLTDTGEMIGPFTLSYGGQPQIVKCL